ncbi:GNAT family N-acetyltransferase [Azotosporobacter soli]|uniref:GNAT family N-acetyltransferase n=1 Tax=Azotosporobacter soli TaxID=3055040 RepID=UPI0031FF1753
MEITFRKAQEEDAEILTRISFAAKRHWSYPEECFAIWKDELTITPAYIRKNTVLIAEADGETVAYASVVSEGDESCLQHVFVLPLCIGKGIGSKLVTEMKKICAAQAIACLTIFSDPHAQGFYDKIGARYVDEFPSNIPGRNVAMYELAIGN